MRRLLIGLLFALSVAPAGWAQTVNAPSTIRTTAGSLTAGGQSVTLSLLGHGAVAIQITGTWTGTLQYEATLDNSTWVNLQVWPADTVTAVTSTTGNGLWHAPTSGFSQFRVRASTLSSGTAVVTVRGSPTPSRHFSTSTGGTSATDDVAFTAGSGTGTPSMGFVTADTVDSGDVGVFAMLANRQQKVTIYDSAGNEATIGGGTQYDEDTASANAEKLTMAGVKRQDTPSTDTSTDGDRTVLKSDNAGRLWVNCAVGCGGSGGTAMTDDAVFTVAVTSFSPVGGTYKSSRDLVDDNDGGVFAMTQRRALYTSPETPNGDSMADDTANAMRAMLVDSAGTFISPSAVDGSNNARIVGAVAHDAAANSADPLLTGCYASVAAPSDVSADADAVRAWCLRNGARAVQPTYNGVLASTGNGVSGTGVIRVTVASDSTGVLGAVGTVAHDAADAGNPLKIGAKASNALSGLTLVANADRTDLYAGLDGALIVRTHANLEDRLHPVPTAITDGSSTSVVAAQGAGVRFCLTTITIANTSVTNVNVDLRDGTAGSVLHTLPAAANTGGATTTFPVPICTTANTALAADPSAAASTITISAVGFKTKL